MAYSSSNSNLATLAAAVLLAGLGTATLAAVALAKHRSCGSTAALVQRLTSAPDEKERTRVESLIAAHPDFPQKGILFRDIFPLLRDKDGLQDLIRLLHQRIRTLGEIDVIVGLESRGFLVGPTLAILSNAGFVPVRKPGKLPGLLTSVTYVKEYGKDTFDVQTGSIKPGARVVIVDDLMATGGSLNAAVNLVQKLGGTVVECIVIIELNDLEGRKNVPANVWSLYDY